MITGMGGPQGKTGTSIDHIKMLKKKDLIIGNIDRVNIRSTFYIKENEFFCKEIRTTVLSKIKHRPLI